MRMGFRTVIVIPETQSQEKKDTLRLCGAELIEVPAVPYSNPNNYVKLSGRLAAQLAKTETNGAIWANQFDNVANRQAHIETTGPEIWQQTDGKVDGFICAVGTGGTLAGVAMALKARNKAVRIALADPMGAALYSYYTTGELKSEGSSITEGIGQGRITTNLEGAPIDTAYQIPDDEAVPIIFDLLEHEGLCLGGSSGINVAGAIRLAKELGPGPHHRDHPVRLRHALSIEAVQSAIPARKEAAGAGMAGAQIEHQGPLCQTCNIRARCRPRSVETHDRHAADPTNPSPLPRRAAGWFRPIGSPNACAIRDIGVVDGSYFLPTQKRDAHAEYRSGHIPGAVFFDIEAVSDHSTDLPHMLPGPTNSARPSARSASATATPSSSMTASVCFPRRGCGGRFGCSARKTSTSSTAGCRNGRRRGRPLENRRHQARRRRSSPPTMNVGAVAIARRRAHGARPTTARQIVDARSAERFAGKAPEPRPGLRSGHMPGSFNVPYDRVVENGRLALARPHRGGVHRRRRRSRQADHHHLRLRRHRRDSDLRARIASAGSRRAFTTAPGPNGARGPILPVERD